MIYYINSGFSTCLYNVIKNFQTSDRYKYNEVCKAEVLDF